MATKLVRDFSPVYMTRYPELSFDRFDHIWRFIDESTGNRIGPSYRSKAELLADLPRFAEQFGCAGAYVATVTLPCCFCGRMNREAFGTTQGFCEGECLPESSAAPC